MIDSYQYQLIHLPCALCKYNHNVLHIEVHIGWDKTNLDPIGNLGINLCSYVI